VSVQKPMSSSTMPSRTILTKHRTLVVYATLQEPQRCDENPGPKRKMDLRKAQQDQTADQSGRQNRHVVLPKRHPPSEARRCVIEEQERHCCSMVRESYTASVWSKSPSKALTLDMSNESISIYIIFGSSHWVTRHTFAYIRTHHHILSFTMCAL
jgi:hypothetical protein